MNVCAWFIVVGMYYRELKSSNTAVIWPVTNHISIFTISVGGKVIAIVSMLWLSYTKHVKWPCSLSYVL